jgi:crotonobetaine/carnitine-CoA ligase
MTHDATLAALVLRKAGEGPDTPILTFVTVGADGALLDDRRSYRDLARNAERLARHLAHLGLRPGERFAIMMHNHPEFVEAMIAAAICGAVFVPIDPRTMGEKLAFMLDHSGCVGAVCTEEAAAALISAAPALAAFDWLVVVGEARSSDALKIVSYADALGCLASPLAPAGVDPDTPMFLMFTSGTTGNPKAVEQTHAQYLAAAYGMRALGVGPGDVLYTGLSLTHINAQGTLRSGLAGSMPVVISRKFTKSRLWDICRAYGCTVFNLLGGMIPEIFSAPPRPDDAENPVRLVISAGMPSSLWNAYRERFGVEICEVYGATEGGGALFNPPGAGPIGSIGRPAPGTEAMAFDENDQACPPFMPGELRFRRADGTEPRIAYFKNAEASRAKIRDGWFRTGDIVHYDDAGWFYFHHRIGGGVRRNGDFVNTALVESAISRSGLVDDVFVYGLATEQNVAGEKTLVASIVPSDPATFTPAALLAYCQDHLARNDVPQIVHMLDAIPKTISEKPIERDCIALLLRDGAVRAF